MKINAFQIAIKIICLIVNIIIRIVAVAVCAFVIGLLIIIEMIKILFIPEKTEKELKKIFR